MTSGKIYIPRKEARPPGPRPSHQQMRICHCMYYEPTSRRWYGMLLTRLVRQMWLLKITDGKSRIACPCLWHTMARLHPASWRSLLVAAIWVDVPQMHAVAGLHKHLAQLIANATLERTANMSWLYTRICLTTATQMLNSVHTLSSTVCVSWKALPLRCLDIWYCYPWLKSITALYDTYINSDVGIGQAASHHNLYGCFLGVRCSGVVCLFVVFIDITSHLGMKKLLRLSGSAITQLSSFYPWTCFSIG